MQNGKIAPVQRFFLNQVSIFQNHGYITAENALQEGNHM